MYIINLIIHLTGVFFMRFIFYLLPCLLNSVSGLLFFITAKRAADANVSSLAVTATLSIWAIIYA